MLILLTASSSGSTGLSNEIVTLAYILTSIATVAAMIAGVRRYVGKQRDKWTAEGKARERALQATQENNSRLEANTRAISELSAKFGEFATSVHQRLDTVQTTLAGHGRRIDRLEDTGHRSD